MKDKDKHLEYTAMDDDLPKRGRQSDDQNQAVDPPENSGGGTSYGPPDADHEAPEESESPQGSE